MERDGSSFALKSKEAMMQRSPTSLKITLEVIRRGAYLSLKECLNMEYNLWNIVPVSIEDNQLHFFLTDFFF